MRMRYSLIVSLFSISLLSGCSTLSSLNPFGEKLEVMAPVPEFAAEFSQRQIWEKSVGKGSGEYFSTLRPAHDNGTIYAADRQGTVMAIDATSGNTIWEIQLAESVGLLSSRKSALLSGGVSVYNNRVYIGSERGILYSIDSATGQLIWEVQAAGEIVARPTIEKDKIMLVTTNGKLQVLNIADGTEVWRADLDVPVLSLRGQSSPITVEDKFVIVGGDNGRINAFTFDLGQLVWQERVAEPLGATEIDQLGDIDAQPVFHNGILYAIAFNNMLVAFDFNSGEALWRAEYGSIRDFIVTDDVIYLTDQNDHIYALNTSDYQLIWKQDGLNKRFVTAPALVGNNIVVADGEGYVFWLNKQTGAFVASEQLDRSGFVADPLTVNTKVILQARKGSVYAIER
ncbi:outer membrane protein assembly factor BamB [Thorsellia anophelis]|uniref:Outer membrane protein assembly factor BamB n=1 Tax=Thorsellia anophelis DSM 18579 TaxID=1123402 RepID=A0A1H9Y3Q5_9GAMM|nr:outer membrane protein assembly factor BamB [Thorsellia anophelis]SES63385.1 Beta-barrel assembly machine subunit BamB [Thorsellia anophelis DSM 18579]